MLSIEYCVGYCGNHPASAQIEDYSIGMYQCWEAEPEKLEGRGVSESREFRQRQDLEKEFGGFEAERECVFKE